MTSRPRMTIRFGDLVVAAFDEAATHSTDPEEVSWNATRMVLRLLRGASTAPAPLREVLLPGRRPGS